MQNTTSFWHLDLKDIINIMILIATIAAIIWGPVKAVQFTQNLEKLREKKRRQYEIFHALMKTRRIILSPEHVSALNLIQLEFSGEEDVLKSYKNYIQILNQQVPAPDNATAFDRFLRERDDNFFELVHQIGRCLGYSFDRRELERFSYVPQGWDNDENQGRYARQLIIELLTGRRALPVSSSAQTGVIPYTGPAISFEKFPPPPS